MQLAGRRSGPNLRACGLASFLPAFFPLLSAIKDAITKHPVPASMTLPP